MSSKKGLWIVFFVCFLGNLTLACAAEPLIPNKTVGGVSAMEERLQQMITVEYKNADLSNVLRSLATTYRINLLTGPDIKGKVTINLQEITVEKALEAILKASGLNYSKKDGVIYISAGDPSLVDIATEVIQLKYLTATQAQNITRKMLSNKGDMKINEAANNVIVSDYQENIDKIKKLLNQADLAPKQVLIEAKILDIDSKDLEAIGVAWSADYTPGKGLFDRDTKFSESLKTTTSMGSTLTSTIPGGQFGSNLFDTPSSDSKPITLALNGVTIKARIDALVRDNKAHLLASPSIAVINGQEARIIIGERFPYKETTATSTGTIETTKFVDIGVSLKVSPQINDDGYITLGVHPEVSSLKEARPDGPYITTREADTTVRIKEGETLVIGGLIRQADNRTVDKVPILGDIPIFGSLFSRKAIDVQQTELAVFITPRILYSREEQEALGRKVWDAENKYTLLDKTASLSMVQKIFDMATALEKGTGVESVRKNSEFRNSQAISQYELIYKQFPDSERAPEAKYRVGLIQWHGLKEFKEAKNTFSTLILDHPFSPWAEKAKQAHSEISAQLLVESKKTL